MRLSIKTAVILSSLVYAALLFAQSTEPKTIRGWLSDEQCARGRASSGIYTGTNPRCAKECVAKGKKIVLINEDEKTITVVANQAAAKEHIGDYVEISGSMAGPMLHIDTLKLVTKGVAACERPTLERK